MKIQKFAVITPLTLACTAALLGGCGGGGASDAPIAVITPPAAAFVGVTLSGTAATGLAIAGAKLEAKCATGSGTATTGTDGAYTLKIEAAALPCMLRVSSTDGATVLHSVADGTGAQAATANVTPLTELVVAQAIGAVSTPATLFSSYTSATAGALSSARLAAAKTSVASALKSSVDFTGIDPLSSAFKASSSSSAPGDATDKKLDELMAAMSQAKVTVATLSNALLSTPDAVGATLSAPPLASCPSLRNGAYVMVSRRGDVEEIQLDLAKLKATDSSGNLQTLVAASEACRFTVLDAQGVTLADVAFGAQGVGLAVTPADANGDRATTLVFPKQAPNLAALAGSWNLVEWNRRPTVALPSFGLATATLTADGAGVFQGCKLAADVADCTDAALKNSGSLSTNAKGQVLIPGGGVGYVYRTSDGTQLVAWGKPNGDGMALLARAEAITLPTAGSTRKVWESYGSSTLSRPDTFVASALSAFDLKFTSVSGSKVTLGTGQVLTFNKPMNGFVYRPAGSAGTDSWGESVGLEIKGVMLVVGANSSDSASFGISLIR